MSATAREAEDLRRELGLTMDAFATLLNVSSVTPSRWSSQAGESKIHSTTGAVIYVFLEQIRKAQGMPSRLIILRQLLTTSVRSGGLVPLLNILFDEYLVHRRNP
jgi:hypothetical protein